MGQKQYALIIWSVGNKQNNTLFKAIFIKITKSKHFLIFGLLHPILFHILSYSNDTWKILCKRHDADQTIDVMLLGCTCMTSSNAPLPHDCSNYPDSIFESELHLMFAVNFKHIKHNIMTKTMTSQHKITIKLVA